MNLQFRDYVGIYFVSLSYYQYTAPEKRIKLIWPKLPEGFSISKAGSWLIKYVLYENDDERCT